MIDVLLIGGQKDGQRVKIENECPYIEFPVPPEMPPLVPIVAELDPETCWHYRREVYYVQPLLDAGYIGIHESLTFRKALEALIQRYPQPLD